MRGLESEMEEFEQSSNALNRKLKGSSQVCGLESGINEIEPSSDTGNRQ